MEITRSREGRQRNQFEGLLTSFMEIEINMDKLTAEILLRLGSVTRRYQMDGAEPHTDTLAAINSVTEPSNMDKLTLKSCRDWERGVMRYQMDGAEPLRIRRYWPQSTRVTAIMDKLTAEIFAEIRSRGVIATKWMEGPYG
jgi:hypothetical protein